MAAGEEKLRLVLSAIDKTAAPIRAVNRRISKMTAPVRKVKNALRSLAKEAHFDKLGRSALKLGKSLGVAAMKAGAFAAVGLGLAVGRAASSGVSAAAAYESLGVRLKVLTGNAEGARQVLEGVDKLATKTPFSLEELGNTAASMGVIFKGNTDRVAEFTAIASDLAAAYGKPVQQIGENLQRAFSAGLGSADVLREAGISAEILKITGASKAADLSAGQLAAALRKMTAEGGPAFNAAAEQAQTLAGSISNSQIAVGNVTRSLGQALSPVISSVLNSSAIPAFESLQRLIDSNAERISGGLFAAMDRLRAIWAQVSAGFVSGFSAMQSIDGGAGSLGEAFAELRAALSELFDALGGWETVGKVFGVVIGGMVRWVTTLWEMMAKVINAATSLAPVVEKAAGFLGFETTVAAPAAGSAALTAAEVAANSATSQADVGGRISIELDDRRARIKNAEANESGLDFDLAGGEALAPA